MSHTITFYRHCDGYPASALQPILVAISKARAAIENGYGRLALVQAADCLASMKYPATKYRDEECVYELTESHNAHGDTDYRYHVALDREEPIVAIDKRTRNASNGMMWEYSGWQRTTDCAVLCNNDRLEMNITTLIDDTGKEHAAPATTA